MSRLSSYCLVVAWSAWIMISPVSAADLVQPTVDQVIAGYMSALGGARQVAQVRTMVVQGVYREGDVTLDATVARMRPYFKLVGTPGKRSAVFEEGYDGSAWEYYAEAGIVLRTVGAPSEAERHSTAVLGTLADYRAQGCTVKLLGSADIGGRKAWRIRLRMRDGYAVDEFIDADTSQLVAERQVAQIHAVGQPVHIEQHFSDFRSVEGVTIPFLREEVDMDTGKVLNRFETTSVTINQDLDPGDFSPPDFERSPVQTLIETLFVQRDDAATLLWTLADFRRAHPQQSTDLATRIAGYQMIKAGRFDAAIALLAENAREYPASAAAASSLGRACANAGKVAAARAALKRALELDPQDKRARAALAALPKSS